MHSGFQLSIIIMASLLILVNISAMQTAEAHGGAGSPGHEKLERVAIIQYAFAEESKIPGWIKNTAGWWAEGQIQDSDFIQSMEFLIQEKIIQVPTTAAREEKSDTIPEWVKNNAGWWSDGLISDNDFVNGIQFMIKNGIISIQDLSKHMEMDSSEISQQMSDDAEKMIMDKAAETTTEVSEEMNEIMDEDSTEPQVEILKTGEFEGLFFHHAKGDAKIIKVGDDIFLRFENFEVTNGPDLRVYLTPKGDVGQGIHLAKLKGSMGDQNYSLVDIDLDINDTVVIYCQPFGVPFGQAKLT